MDAFLFHEKVHRPDPRGLVRERLERGLLDPDGPTSALLLGPPGAGKTTLLSRVTAAAGGPHAWYRASAEDDDEAALVRHLGHALQEALDEDRFGEVVGRPTVDRLLSALETFAPPGLTLVVDDVHSIAGSAAERALERLLVLRPRAVRVLLASRRPPQMNTSRLLANGELRQLDAEDLRFRSWEVEELFRAVYQQPLSPESAAALTRRTGGWAAGLQLFHLGTAELTRHGREKAVAELSGRSQLIRSYLTRNVLEGLEDSRRQFLLGTCTLGVLTGELCDALLGQAGSAAVLDDLERLQFFTSSTDGGRTYRFHQVLQTHLEVLLVDERGPAAARALYVRSADLLERDGRAAAAVRAYARAEDWGAVARLLHQGSSSLPADEWLGNLLGRPGVPAEDPGLGVAGARRLLRDGRVADAVAAYRQAESLVDDPDFQARCAAERAAAAVWLPGSPGPVPGTVEASTALGRAQQLRALTQRSAAPDGMPSGLLRGLAHLFDGDADAAVRTLGALGGTEAGGWEQIAGRLALLLAESVTEPAAAAPGRLEEIVLSADLEDLPWLARLARGFQAALLFVAQPSPFRAAPCNELIEECEHRGDGWAVCLLSGYLGWLQLRSGRPEQAVPHLRRCVQRAVVLQAPVLELWGRGLLVRTGAVPEAGEEQVALLAGRARAAGLLALATMLTGRRTGPMTMRGGPEPLQPPAAAVAGYGEVGDAPEVRLRCLGGFALTVDGRAVDWRALRPRARLLLQRLALDHGRPVHRERLIDALWPELTLASGTRSLQVAVSSVRQCLAAQGLPDGSIRRDGDAYALHLPAAVDQLRDFERLVGAAARREAAGRLAEAAAARFEALDLYTGELLPEAGPAEWVVAERDRLRSLAAEVASEAARAALEAGELTQGLRAARRSLDLEPYHDPSWRLLARLLERLGDASGAAVCRRDHARALAELGLPVPAAP